MWFMRHLPRSTLYLAHVREKWHVDVPVLVCSSCPSNDTPGLQHCFLRHVAYMLQQVVHQRVHIAKDTRNFQLNAANHTAVIALFTCAVGCLLFDVTLGQKYPLVPDARLRSVYVRVYDSLFLGLSARQCNCVGVPTEVARSALPNFLGIVHARRHRAKRKTFLGLFAHIPSTLAEAPVVVIFAGAAIHHTFLSRLWRSNRGRWNEADWTR